MLKLSARNRFPGTIIDIRRGAAVTYVRTEIAPGMVCTAAITKEAA